MMSRFPEEVGIVAPASAPVRVPSGVHRLRKRDLLFGRMPIRRNVVAVYSNANRSHATVLGLVLVLRLRRRRTRSVAVCTIDRFVEVVGLRLLLALFDEVVPVSPLPWERSTSERTFLGLSKRQAFRLDTELSADLSESPKVRLFARPDPVKGLHMLPDVMSALRGCGVGVPVVEVALGDGEPGNDDYRRALNKILESWLVEGQRDPTWLEHGDIFLGLSLTETAYITAQECMWRGALVVVPRTGVISVIAERTDGVFAFQPGDAVDAARALAQALALDKEERRARGAANKNEVARMVNSWYEQFASQKK